MTPDFFTTCVKEFKGAPIRLGAKRNQYVSIKNGLSAILMQNELLTSGRLRAPIADAGLKSGPIGMRMLCSNTSFSV